MLRNVMKKIYFSPGGTTKRIIDIISTGFGHDVQEYNLLTGEPQNIIYAESEYAVVAAPVFSGRIPPVFADKLNKMKGCKTPAIAVVVYGNRDYEDALLELKNILEDNGFVVIAAAAFIARHSIFPEIASDRPDREDIDKINLFTQKCIALLNCAGENIKNSIEIKGNMPYRKMDSIPLKPSANSKCRSCKACAKVCPVGAIDTDNQKIFDKKKCISCAACIYACKHNARNFRGLLYWLVRKKFIKKFTQRREPETFF